MIDIEYIAQETGRVPLALHACCGPCSLEPVASLRDEGFEPVILWDNPNIQPVAEHDLRLATLLTWADIAGIAVVRCERGAGSGVNSALTPAEGRERWERVVAPHGFDRVPRCRACYTIRLDAACRVARELGFSHVSTTLAVSPYQLFEDCTEILERLAAANGLMPIVRDWRPLYPKATTESRELGMYRQNYCGCRFSAAEATIERHERRDERKAARRARYLARCRLGAATRLGQVRLHDRPTSAKRTCMTGLSRLRVPTQRGPGCARSFGVVLLGNMGLLARIIPSIGHRASPAETLSNTGCPSVTSTQSVIRAADARGRLKRETNMGMFDGKVVIVTGGGKATLKDGSAGSIGYGIDIAFAKEGANLVITGRNVAKLEAAKESLEAEYGIKVLAVQADVSAGQDNEAVVQNVIDKTIEEFGRIDAVVNNAQASASGVTIEQHTMDQFNLAIYSGLYATFLYMQKAYPHLKEIKGSVVNFASGAGLFGNYGQCSYSAAKEGIRGLTRVAANEWGKDGVNVNIVCPLAWTAQLENFEAAYPEAFKANVHMPPAGHYGDVETEIGRVVVQLCGPDFKYMNGETITLEGGMSQRP